MTYFNGVTEKLEDMVKLMDKWGGPETYPHMAAGWAVALDSPFQWTKQVASDFGGTRVGMVAHWPKGIKAKNEMRPQFSHVIDIAPTILEAAGLPEPKVVNGTPQIPMEGKSLVYTFDNAHGQGTCTPPSTSRSPATARSITTAGWPAPFTRRRGNPSRAARWRTTSGNSTIRAPTSASPTTSPPQNPEKLKELQAVFLAGGTKYNVLPIDDRVFERLNGAAWAAPISWERAPRSPSPKACPA